MTVPFPAASLMEALVVAPSPQSTVAVCVSLLPASVNGSWIATVEPFGADGACWSAPTIGTTLPTLSVAVLCTGVLTPSLTVIVAVMVASSSQRNVNVGADSPAPVTSQSTPGSPTTV